MKLIQNIYCHFFCQVKKTLVNVNVTMNRTALQFTISKFPTAIQHLNADFFFIQITEHLNKHATLYFFFKFSHFFEAWAPVTFPSSIISLTIVLAKDMNDSY